MEVDGKEFMRNVGIEQDKERLAQEQKRLEALKREAYLREEENARMQNQEESTFADISLNSAPPLNRIDEPTVEDLKLAQDDPDKTKRRYILLGIALILVFVITILVIRIISNSDTEEKMENLNPQQQELSTDKILNKIDTNEEYQKAIDKNLAKEEAKKLDEAKKSKVPDVGIDEEKVENTPLVIEKPKPKEKPKKDLFGLNEQKKAVETSQSVTVKQEVTKTQPKIVEVAKQTQKTVTKVSTPPKKIVKPVVQKPKTIKPAPKAIPKQTTQNISGFYIQVGAFTKQPSEKLLSEIKAKGFSYVIHPMTIKGTKYNKVLIGAYPTRQSAQNNLNVVKQKLKKPGAYILKI